MRESHFRVGRRIACGRHGGNTAAALHTVTCADCRPIAMLAEADATVCGCHRPDVHLGVARARYEIAGHLR